MKFPTAITRCFHPSHRLCLIGSIVVVGILLVAGLAVWNRYDETITRARVEMNNLGVVLAAQNARSLQVVDLVLQEVQGMVRGRSIVTPDEFRDQLNTEDTHDYLVDRLHSLPQVNAISLIDDHGRIISFSRTWPAPPIDVTDRDFYAHFRDHDDRNVFIGKPVINKITGAWVITLTRRIDAPDGRFLGIVLGVVNVGDFERFYQTVATERGESVALFRRDGTLLARYPHRDADIGRTLPRQSAWHEFAARGGMYRTPSFVDGIPRVVSIHPVADFPLDVSVGVTDAAVLADWQYQSLMMMIGALAAAIGFSLLFHMLATQAARLRGQAADLENAAAALVNSETRFRDFALTSSDWLWETDAQHLFTYLSDNIRNFGQDPQTRIGRTRMELAADAGGEAEKWAEHRALLDRHEPFRDFVYRRKVGGDPEGYVSVSGKPIFGPDGNFVGYRGTVRDITQQVLGERSLRAAKSAAEAANLAKSQFLANMSHELRTPLNAILGFSEMLQHGLVGPLSPQQQEYSGLIHQSGRHLLNVINEILDLARVDAGKLELREERGVDPRHIVDSCVRLVNARTASEMPHLEVDLPDETPLLTVDPTRLTQILLNLMSNAAKFTGKDGTVTVAMRSREDGGAEFEVRDTGLGMTAAEIEIALEPFGQVDSTNARQHEGTGLGLPLARRLAELHGGSLTVLSEKGRGTTVIVALPAARVQFPAPPPMEPQRAMSAV